MFLLIHVAIEYHLPVIEFTFHYVSTYTRGYFLRPKENNWFTFHYVSTYTSCIGKKATDPSIFTFHYVSTYTLHIHIPVWLLCLFTFHYVSTYTMLISPQEELYLYLHSTMFLLILFWLPLLPQMWEIYIPLCFYLYYGCHYALGLMI